MQQKSKLTFFLEWAQMVTGLTAASLVSLNIGDYWVFVAMCLFFVKDTMMGVFAYINKFPGIIASSVGYVIIDAIGIARWAGWF